MKADHSCAFSVLGGARLAFMQFNPNGLVITAAFFGLLWFALEHGVDYGVMGALVLVALNVALGWLLLGVIADAPWPRRRGCK